MLAVGTYIGVAPSHGCGATRCPNRPPGGAVLAIRMGRRMHFRGQHVVLPQHSDLGAKGPRCCQSRFRRWTRTPEQLTARSRLRQIRSREAALGEVVLTLEDRPATSLPPTRDTVQSARVECWKGHPNAGAGLGVSWVSGLHRLCCLDSIGFGHSEHQETGFSPLTPGLPATQDLACHGWCNKPGPSGRYRG